MLELLTDRETDFESQSDVLLALLNVARTDRLAARLVLQRSIATAQLVSTAFEVIVTYHSPPLRSRAVPHQLGWYRGVFSTRTGAHVERSARARSVMGASSSGVVVPPADADLEMISPRAYTVPGDGPGGRLSSGWFAPLQDVLASNNAIAAPREASGQYIAVLDPAVEGTKDRVAALTTAPRTYEWVPLVRFVGDLAVARNVAATPGVFAVLPAPPSSEESDTIVQGFDTLMAVERLQRFGDPARPDVVGGSADAQTTSNYPVLEPGSPPILDLTGPTGVATAPALMPVINFSVGTLSPQHEASLDDPVNIATAAAAVDQLVVAAAGNEGEAEQETMSAWAQMPWVLSVGAMEDVEGTRLGPKSSRGVPGDPKSGPDVVAYGVRANDESLTAWTSFAAPRVTQLALVAAAAVLQIRHVWLDVVHQSLQGVQLVGPGFIDHGFDGFRKRVIEVPALPLVGPDRTAVTEAISLLQRAGIELDVRGTPELLRRMLLAAARPVPEYGPHEVGAGFLDRGVFLDWLGRLTGRDLVRLFTGGDRTAPMPAGLDALRLFDRDALEVLVDVVVATMPLWAYEYGTKQLGRIP